ncbi:hypothetical protein [Rhodopirellula bahusiensis]
MSTGRAVRRCACVCRFLIHRQFLSSAEALLPANFQFLPSQFLVASAM